MTLSFWQRQAQAPEVTVDIAIVGGGLIGCSTAYWLRQLRPEARVAIVEAQHLAAGASGRNAGFLLQGTGPDYMGAVERYGAQRARALWHFTRENRALLATELTPSAFQLETSGSLTVAGSADEDERLQEAVSRMRQDGAPVAYIPPDATNQRLMAQHFHGALYVPSGAMLDPVALVRHIAAASEARVLAHHQVVAVQARGDAVDLVTPRRRVRAGQVLLALNAYLPLLVPALRQYVRPVRAQMLATVPQPSRWLHVPAYTHDGYYYIRQRADGTVLLGGARHLHRAEEVGYADETTEALQRDLEAYLHRHFPQLRDPTVRHRWSGTMGFSPDGLPSYGAVPGLPGSFWAAGFTGYGLAYGFHFGRVLAQVALGHSLPEGADLFAADRFEEAQAKASPFSEVSSS
ncbi:MAG: FAD-dependent oxidoreductase [Bacteroidetes bacterium]|jgi:glycine/D-amino acid oxidase-like deaminating enzyme|nr:FAD-dependent oxidoreductase [Bacteroidota bacterium]